MKQTLTFSLLEGTRAQCGTATVREGISIVCLPALRLRTGARDSSPPGPALTLTSGRLLATTRPQLPLVSQYRIVELQSSLPSCLLVLFLPHTGLQWLAGETSFLLTAGIWQEACAGTWVVAPSCLVLYPSQALRNILVKQHKNAYSVLLGNQKRNEL